MLRVAKVRRGGHAYYLDVAGDGLGSGIEAPGQWLGAGAGDLGLSGKVDGDALAAVLAGAHPVTGDRLGVAHDRVTVVGFDLSFCAPKSVSLLHALGEREVATEVGAAHTSAVQAAFAYVEEHAVAVRRRAGDVLVPVEAGAVAAAAFVHRVSRALDPHLHSHVIVANLGRGPEGRFTALDGRGLYAHAAAAGALYQLQLRHELTQRLGVAWEPLRAGRADIAGIGVDARRVFSSRAAAIGEHLATRGLGGRRARDIAAHATRPPRDVHVSADDLRPWWRSRARRVGLGPTRMETIIDRVPRQPGLVPDASHDVVVVRELLHRGGVVARRDVVRAWGRSLPAGAPVPVVGQATDRVLATLPVAARHTGRHEGRGVSERRHVLEGPVVELARRDRTPPDRAGEARRHRAELRSLLAARGTVVDFPSRGGAGRAPTNDMGMAMDGGLGLG